MPRATIVGVGMTYFGVHDEPLEELFAGAAFEALDDAGQAGNAIEAFYLGNALGAATENDSHLAPKLASHLGLPRGLPCQRFEDACATSANAFKHAVEAIEAGRHRVVLVGGVERCTPETGLDTPEMTRIFASASDRLYEQPAGLTFPGVFALLTKRHMYEYGTTEEQLAEVSVKNHYHGTLNPRAHFGDEADVDEVLESPLIADPFHLMDCCPFSDGAAAVVLAHPDEAPRFTEKPVQVTGIGHATDVLPLADKEDLKTTQAARDASDQAYRESGVKPEDLDLVELHDCFTGAEVIATEALGLVEDGQGGPAAADGYTRIDGEMPVNPSGGLKAKGHPIGATGVAQLVELTDHLRGEAGDRQIDGAQTGLAHNLGGDAATTLVTVVEA